MKKFVSVIFCLLCFMLTACVTPLEKREPNLSELRDEVLTAASDSMSVSLVSGVREEPFVIDGSAGEKQPFTVVTISPKGFRDSATFAYELHLGDSKLSGNFSKHPFKNTWSFEVGERVTGSVALTVTSDGYAENFELKSVKTDTAISADEALEIAEIRLKSRIKEMTEGGLLRAEVYVRYLENPISSDGGYYWYVAFVPDKYTVYAVLIHPETKEIVAVRE